VQKTSAFLTAAAAVTLLAACAGGSPSASSSLPATGASAGRARFDVARSGAAPGFMGALGRGHAATHRAKPAGSSRVLYVDDWNLNAIEILKYRRWTNLGNNADGVDGPDGNWVDKSGNLYVANYANESITEYNSAGNLIFTYTGGISDSIGVTTDKNGNVYEADFDYPNLNGYVNEYAQQSNTVAATCSPGGGVESVAVDKQGDVFAAYNNSSYTAGYIVEYPGGLTASGCSGTVLPITLAYAGGMVFDNAGNLVVCDQGNHVVDVLAPPYSSVTSTLGSGFEDPFHVTIDRKNDLAYVADLDNETVSVLDYPSGSLVATLGSANGLSMPAAAVDSKNYLP
jgi:hypothetical protein